LTGNISEKFERADPKMVWKSQPSGKCGRQQQFSDPALQTCLTLKDALPDSQVCQCKTNGRELLQERSTLIKIDQFKICKFDKAVIIIKGHMPISKPGHDQSTQLPKHAIDMHSTQPDRICNLDLSQFDAAPLIALTTTKEIDYGTEMDRRIPARCGAYRADQWADTLVGRW
jgi:hypothetical protein